MLRALPREVCTYAGIRGVFRLERTMFLFCFPSSFVSFYIFEGEIETPDADTMMERKSNLIILLRSMR